MYDRRIVRGNTFAALVIPVSTNQIKEFNFDYRYATRSSLNREAEVGADDKEVATRNSESNSYHI